MSGYGFGAGYGSGSGFGYGDGDGYGYGYGFGSGYGIDTGHGSKLGEVSGKDVTLLHPVDFQVIRVGCQVHTLDHWRTNWRDIAEEHSVAVTEAEVSAILDAVSSATRLT